MKTFKHIALASACFAWLSLPAAAADPDPLEEAERHLQGALAAVQAAKAARAGAAAPVTAAVAPAPAAVAPPAPAPAALKPGAVVTVRPAPKAPAAIPEDSVGEFVITKEDRLYVGDASKHGLRGYHGTVSFELAGLLVAKDKGRYQVGFEGEAPKDGANWVSDCSLRMWVEDAPLPPVHAPFDSRYEQSRRFSLLSGIDLEPGVYRLRAWVGCVDNSKEVSTRRKELGLVPLFMAPADKGLRVLKADDLMHRE